MDVAQIKVHNAYNQSSYQDNDFALLKLATPVPLSSTVGIACIAPDLVYDGQTVIITGWGYTTPGGPQSPTLKQANVVAMSNAACAASGMNARSSEVETKSKSCQFIGPAYKNLITNNMICATTASQTTDACLGDSGGKITFSKVPKRVKNISNLINY